MVDVRVVSNLPEFRRQLSELGERIERKLVVRGLNAAGKVFRDEARRRAPVLQAQKPGRVAGALRGAIFVGRSKASRQGRPVRVVGVRATQSQIRRGRNPFYWRFLEAGWIPRGPGKRLKGGSRSRALGRERALKAGARKVRYPFLGPAFEAKSDQALQAFVDTVSAGIAQENQRQA